MGVVTGFGFRYDMDFLVIRFDVGIGLHFCIKCRCVKMQHVFSPCPAGLDPASHPVKPVGTQRVALGRESMGLRVRPAMTRTHFDTPPNIKFRFLCPIRNKRFNLGTANRRNALVHIEKKPLLCKLKNKPQAVL